MDWWQSLRDSDVLYFGFLLLLGAMAGSFSSAAIHRLPAADMTMTNPRRSKCPGCGYQLRWYDNLPVLSYLFLLGSCRSCGQHISVAYLLNEVFLAGVFLFLGTCSWAAEVGPVALAVLLAVITALWIAAVIDWNHFILPDEITVGGLPVAVLASVLVPQLHLWSGDGLPWGLEWVGLSRLSAPWLLALASSLIGAATSFILLFGIRALFSYLLRQEALGFGDVKYMASVGALVGLEGSLWVLLVGVATGSILGIVNVVRMILVVHYRRQRRGRNKSGRDTLHLGWMLGRQIPFGPPLIIGTVLVLLLPLATRTFFLETWPAFLRDCIN